MRLEPEERQRLIMMLCDRVVRALRESGVVERIVLVSGDDQALAFGASLGLVPIREAEPGLNAALRTATAWAMGAGAVGQLIVLPDLPLLASEDIRAIARHAAERTIVVCPDRSHRGTNLLLLRPCDAIPPMFGTSSFARHLQAIHSAGLPARIYESPGTNWDIDTPEDVDRLQLRI